MSKKASTVFFTIALLLFILLVKHCGNMEYAETKLKLDRIEANIRTTQTEQLRELRRIADKQDYINEQYIKVYNKDLKEVDISKMRD